MNNTNTAQIPTEEIQDPMTLMDSIAKSHGVSSTPSIRVSRRQRLLGETPKNNVPYMQQTAESPMSGINYADQAAKNKYGEDSWKYKLTIPYKAAVNFGTGIGTAIGNAGLGLGEAALKSASFLGKGVGADTTYADRAVNKLDATRKELYGQEGIFKDALNTGSGKAGTLVGNIAPYVASAGAADPATAQAGMGAFSRTLARTFPDLVISAGQSGGDIKSVAGTGAASLVANALLPGLGGVAPHGFKENLKQMARETVPGYVSDVASGLSGYRGEDRTGAKAFIPGAGTAFSGAMAGTMAGSRLISDRYGAGKVQRIVDKRVEELDKLEKNNSTLRNLVEKNKAKGIDVKRILAETDLLKDSVDDTGTIRTQNAMDELNDFIKPQENVISANLAKEGKKLPIKYVQKTLREAIENSDLEGAALKSALKKVDSEVGGYQLRGDKDGMISLSKIQDAKVNKYATIDYLNPASKQADKIIAKSLKELIENNTQSIDVKALNQELGQHYAVMSLLEKLDGKKVEGGKLGKYFASTIGGMVGSHFGPLGTILGAETGARIKGKLMASTFADETGNTLQQSAAMKRALADIGENDYSSNNVGSLNQSQAATSNTTSKVIPNSVTQTVKAVNKGLEDPMLYKAYQEAPEEFVDDMRSYLAKDLRESGDELSAQSVESVGKTNSFKDFVNKVYKALGGDLPNQEGGFISAKAISNSIDEADDSITAQSNTDSVDSIVNPKASAKDLNLPRSSTAKTMKQDLQNALLEKGKNNAVDLMKGKAPVKQPGGEELYKYYKNAIKSSEAIDVDRAIKSGDFKASDVYKDVKTKVLTPEFAQGRIDDVANKLNNYEKGLGDLYKVHMKGTEVTQDAIVKKGLDILQERSLGMSMEKYKPHIPTFAENIKTKLDKNIIEDANIARTQIGSGRKIADLNLKLTNAPATIKVDKLASKLTADELTSIRNYLRDDSLKNLKEIHPLFEGSKIESLPATDFKEVLLNILKFKNTNG